MITFTAAKYRPLPGATVPAFIARAITRHNDRVKGK